MPKWLHGSEVIEMDDGVRAITSTKMSVIGIALESDDASPATKAALAVGAAVLGDDLMFTAVSAGKDGNAISITIQSATEADAVASVDVLGKAITITLATNADTLPTTKVTDIPALIEGSNEAKALVLCTTTTDEDDAGIPDIFNKSFLEGGLDEPFPELKPVLITGRLSQAKGLGVTSEAYKSMRSIMDQTGALVVAVRAKKITAPEKSGSNIIEAINKFSEAKAETQYKPRILIAPRFSHIDGVAKALESQAARLRGFAYVDCEQTATYIDAMKRAKSFGSRVEVQWPMMKVHDTDLNQEVPRPTSEFAAGLRARIDAEKGVHWSKSNQEIYNVVGTWVPVEWELSDENCVANVLNQNKVSTVIREGGYRFWGNRSCATDPKWTFECVRRVADMINDSIESAHLWAVDMPGTTQYLQDVISGVKSYMAQLRYEGVIPGGDAWLDKELNTPETMSKGIVYFDFDYGVYYPMEHLIFRSRLNMGYLEEVISNV
ncbi:phage tail protein [Vibrio coralliilyticus]|uniref:phage tail sheath subtilisin-like domain-containing protein n=1 Tax=Vibrio coralliilyticus TaxID=190893 RepID=UPI00148BB35A|nr:phage tail sheath subtilisin-like domain-containing protein [Vibrio coralliilyticus]NOI20818.1 phage tail protein [Vibrio coralliilyticus]